METITATDSLLRRVPHFYILESGRRISSAAFKSQNEPTRISVELARLTSPEETQLRGGKQFGVVSLLAQVPLDLGFDVLHDPLPDNEAHSVISGENDKVKQSAMAQRCVLVIQPQPREDDQ